MNAWKIGITIWIAGFIAPAIAMDISVQRLPNDVRAISARGESLQRR